jgi:D-serine dehydratase
VSSGFVVDDRLKGVPLGTPPFPIEDAARRNWNLLRGDVRLPAAVLKDSALRHNGAWMRRFLAASGAWFAPHGKTTMSPELFQRQREDGAWGLTLATMGQVRAARRHGVSRVYLANVVADGAEAAWAVDELRRDDSFEMLFLVDSEDSVALLAAAARAGVSRPLELMLERGYPGGRTGCRSLEQALALARSVRAGAPHLTLRGVSGFEGLLSADDVRVAEARVSGFLDSIRETAESCDQEQLFGPGPTLLSAGGSAFYDLVIERFGVARLTGETRVLVRSGCYLTQDGGPYERAFARIQERSGAARELGPGLLPALELWAQVLSRPEPTRAVANLGKRDASHDLGLPRPTAVFRQGRDSAPVPLSGVTTAGLNDQHALLDVPPDCALRPGDRVAFTISHPCLTFDRWPLLFVVDDAYQVIGAVHTLF